MIRVIIIVAALGAMAGCGVDGPPEKPVKASSR